MNDVIEWIKDNYANQDMSHEDFRVEAYSKAVAVPADRERDLDLIAGEAKSEIERLREVGQEMFDGLVNAPTPEDIERWAKALNGSSVNGLKEAG